MPIYLGVTYMSEEVKSVSEDFIDPIDSVEDEFVKNKIEFINRYKKASNTANAYNHYNEWVVYAC